MEGWIAGEKECNALVPILVPLVLLNLPLIPVDLTECCAVCRMKLSGGDDCTYLAL